MKLKDVLEFRKDLFFEGAVQADWFYNRERAAKVAESFVFHGSHYYGIEDEANDNLIDTVSFVKQLGEKLVSDDNNPLSLAIADYGTGKSHLAVTLAELYSGRAYNPETFDAVISNIATIDQADAEAIKDYFGRRNFVLVINGMRDFNLHSELLRATKRSLELYGLPDDNLRKLNRTLDTAGRFFERNCEKSIDLFEKSAEESGLLLKGEELKTYLKDNLLIDDKAFAIVNKAYAAVNGQEIQWDEGISASSIIDMIISEYCGMDGQFDHVVLLFDEFGRYLEYASGVPSVQSGDSALQLLFECTQNSDGLFQIVNFIQSDIKTYLQRVDQTKNISRYIGRYDASDKYHISSNLETVFANLINRKDADAFNNCIVDWQKRNEEKWKQCFKDMNRWLNTNGIWKNYKLFRNVVVEGIYPMHPLSTYMLTHLSDYLQNRSSLMLVNEYITKFADNDISEKPVLVMPELMMTGDLYTEMLSAEEEGRQRTLYCISYSNVLRKFADKLDQNALTVLRGNLILRILKFRTDSYDDVLKALELATGLGIDTIRESLNWLENEYAVLTFDDHANCFDFSEESSGAHDYKIIKKQLIAKADMEPDYLMSAKVYQLAKVTEPIATNFNIKNKISTNEWAFSQELMPVQSFDSNELQRCVHEWENAVSSTDCKGKIIWLYANKDTAASDIETVQKLANNIGTSPILIMLLNDADNKLWNTLLEYKVLDSMDATIQNKFQRYYEADYQNIQIFVQRAFDDLKAERNRITRDGITPISERMTVALTETFESVYPKAISFPFDSFLTKTNKLSGKGVISYCSILRILLSGNISADTIHNNGVEVRNHIQALLDKSSVYSWRCLTADVKIMPPENKKAKEIYDKLVNEIQEQEKVSVQQLMAELCQPPYGLSKEIILMMIGVVCANIGYNLRFEVDDELLAIAVWRDHAVKDKKIDYAYVDKSSLVWVDAGKVEEKFIHLYTQIEGTTDVLAVIALENSLDNLIKENQLPETLEVRNSLAKAKFDRADRARQKWVSEIYKMNSAYDKIYDHIKDPNNINVNSILKQLDDATELGNSIEDIFGEFTISSELETMLDQFENECRAAVEKYSPAFIAGLECENVESITQFTSFYNNVQKRYSKLGYVDYALKVKEKGEAEILNIGIIKSKQELNGDINKFLVDTNSTAFKSYEQINEMIKVGNDLQKRVNMFSTSLGKTGKDLAEKLSKRLDELNEKKTKIEDSIAGMWDEVDELETYEDVPLLLEDVNLVISRGLPAKDYNGIIDLKDGLETFIADLNTLKESERSYNEYLDRVQQLQQKYMDSEDDFNAEELMNKAIEDIAAKFKEKELQWSTRYLSLDNKTRDELLSWLDQTKVLPEYLSESSKNKYSDLRKVAEKKLSDGRLEDVLFYYKKLNAEEQAEFKKMINS